MIKISTNGSFQGQYKQFSAMEHGHAHAVAEAIKYLVVEVLPTAISKDHVLHDEKHYPLRGFIKND